MRSFVRNELRSFVRNELRSFVRSGLRSFVKNELRSFVRNVRTAGETRVELAGGTGGGHGLEPAYKKNSKNPISKAELGKCVHFPFEKLKRILEFSFGSSARPLSQPLSRPTKLKIVSGNRRFRIGSAAIDV